MSTGTEVAVRAGFDLTRAPSEQWNHEMLQMVAKQLFRGQEMTESALYYCLSVAEGLGLNPLVGEVYFIPSKSRDGKGPTLQPYIGRNGLVKRASQRGYYFESDVVHENDKFRIVRRADGTRTCTHSYGARDRGEIIGAYAFLRSRVHPEEAPAFAYAPLSEYLPSFDQDWKMKASPWGNQRSAMIRKVAMIMAGRERLDLGNVLMDGEVARWEQQSRIGPGGEPVEESAEFDWSVVENYDLRERLREAVARVREADATAWPAAKLEMVLSGRDERELGALAAQIEAESEGALSGAAGAAEGRSGDGVGDSSSEGDPSGEGVVDAQVVGEDSLEALRAQERYLEDRLNEPDLSEEAVRELDGELERVRLAIQAGEDPGQERMAL